MAAPRNHNVRLALWWSLFENCSGSVRSGDVLSALLYLVTGSNTTVGLIQGINGVLQMVVALPAGYLADRYRRDTLLRAGAAVGAVAGSVLALALALHPTVWMLGAAMAMLGCYRGIYSAALEAIFADSIQAGRSSLYTQKYAITVIASSFGPWLSLAMFHRLGNRWHVDDCRLVLLSGVALMVVPLLLMCLFDDDKTLQHHHHHTPLPTTMAALTSSTSGGGDVLSCGAGTEPVQCCGNGGLEAAVGVPAQVAPTGDACLPLPDAAAATATAAAAAAAAGAAAAADDQLASLDQLAAHQASSGGCCCSCCACCARLPPGLVVTILISVSDFIGALASGMTLKFFAMFFMQAVKMGPMAVSLIGALSPLGVSAASLACQPLSKVLGRVQISLLTRAVDILLLVSMAYLPTAPAAAHHLLVAVHLARMAVANATRPLMRSVLMDCVPRSHRGKVNAIDSIRTFSWSGSAAAGGWLIERYGFQATFLTTACIKTAAFVPLFFLLAYVPDGVCIAPGTRTQRLRDQQQWQRAVAAATPPPMAAPAVVTVDGAGGTECSGDDSLTQPLLPAAHTRNGMP